MSNSLKESTDRIKASRIVPTYYKWQAKYLKEIFAEIDEAGTENIELRMYPGLNADGYPEGWFKVVHLDESGEAIEDNGGGEYNVSETCPPKC